MLNYWSKLISISFVPHVYTLSHIEPTMSWFQHHQWLRGFHLHDVGASGKVHSPVCNILRSGFFLKNCQPTGCSTWRGTNCCLSNGCLAWAGPGQWCLPLQLLCHAHLNPLNAIPVGNCFGNFKWGSAIKLRFESRKSKLISSILRQLALKIYCELM